MPQCLPFRCATLPSFQMLADAYKPYAQRVASYGYIVMQYDIKGLIPVPGTLPNIHVRVEVRAGISDVGRHEMTDTTVDEQIMAPQTTVTPGTPGTTAQTARAGF